MTIDVERVRADTPGCTVVRHFNHAGSSLPPVPVTETVIGHLRREAEIGGYEAMTEADDRIEAVYRSAAGLIGAQPDEIALLDSATRAWDAAFHGLRLGPADRVLVDRARYPGHSLSMIQSAALDGVRLELIDDDETGQLDLADLARRLDGGVKLVALTHVPTDSGLVNPIAGAGRLCRGAGVPLLVDACQSVGQLAIDVDDLGCDLLSATGRKFLRGPRGTGFLYVRSSVVDRLQPMSLDVVSAVWTSPQGYRLQPGARRFETFERSVAGVLGLGAALDYCAALGPAEIESHVLRLGAALRDRLGTVPGVRIDHRGERQCGIVTFLAGSLPSADVQQALHAAAVNTTITRPEAAADPDRPPPLPRIRASVHYFNTEDEIEVLAHTVEDLLVGCV